MKYFRKTLKIRLTALFSLLMCAQLLFSQSIDDGQFCVKYSLSPTFESINLNFTLPGDSLQNCGLHFFTDHGVQIRSVKLPVLKSKGEHLVNIQDLEVGKYFFQVAHNNSILFKGDFTKDWVDGDFR